MRRAFTLIELLVVISIIALLIALLLPALERAHYTARLVLCNSNQKQAGVGAIAYSSDHDDLWPDRWMVADDGQTASPRLVWGRGDGHDLRALLNPYMSINESLLCPFTDKVDLYPNQIYSNMSEIYGSYAMWFGWYPKGAEGLADPGWDRRMARAGDVMVYNGIEFDVLISDTSQIWTGSSPWKFNSTHPAHGAPLITWHGPITVSSIYQADLPPGGYDPGDLNYIFTDGHGETIVGITDNDPRMEDIRVHRGQSLVQLPPKN